MRKATTKVINLRKRVSVTEPLRPSRFAESIPGNGRSAGLFGDPNSKPALLDEGRKFEPVDTTNRNRVAQGSFSVEGEGGKAFFFILGRFGRLGASFSKTCIYPNHCAAVSPAPAIHNYNESRGGSRFLSGIIRFAPGLGEESERWVRRRGGEKEGKGSSPDDPG